MGATITCIFPKTEFDRQTNNTILGVTTNAFTCDGAGDRLTLTDGKNQTTTWTYDVYGNASNKVLRIFLTS